jgi:circadian clock protein KaiB
MKTIIKLRLFVTGGSETARRAQDNLDVVCKDPAIRNDYDIKIEVIDINEWPGIAEEDRILVTPTLLRKLPEPMRRLVGDLSNENDIYLTLDIRPPGSSPKADGRPA